MGPNETLALIIERIGVLTNSLGPEQEIHKFIIFELTFNPEALDLEYEEIFNIVVAKLIYFYQDEKLKNLWAQYMICCNDPNEDYYDDNDDGGEAAA